MHNLKLIIKREYLARVKNKTFVVMTFLSPIILVGMAMLIGYLSSLNNDEQRVVGIHNATGNFITKFSDSPDVKFENLSEISLEDAKLIVKENEYYGLLHIPDKDVLDASQIQFFAKEAPAFGFLGQIEKTISEEITNQHLRERGIDISALEEAQTSVNIQLQNFSGERTSKISSYVKMFFGGAAGYLLMMFIIIYGNMVMRSVIEEKTNRIVEIIISSVKPLQLMLGKILGTSLAGLTQFAIWVLLGGVLFIAFSAVLGIESPQPDSINQLADNEIQQVILDIAKLPLATILIAFIIYFFGGYFLYSSIYAAIGAAVDNETDTQQFMLPVILPLMLGIYVGFFAVIENPHGTVSTIFSMIPLTSPIVMLMRIPFGVPLWEIGISVLILIFSILGVVWVASKIYRIGILMYGKKPSYKELYKWLKY